MIAAGLASAADAFLSPGEVRALWSAWEDAADAADAVVAAHTTNASVVLGAEAGGEAAAAALRCGGGDGGRLIDSEVLVEYSHGDRSWLRLDADTA